MRAESLGGVLFGKVRGAILGLLFSHADQSFYYRQITRQLTEVSAGGIQRELDTLSRLGLIVRRSEGNQVFYQANRKHPAFAELHALLEKTVGFFPMLRTALAPLAKNIAAAFVYGSVARQEERSDSDIDLMIIGRVSLEKVLEQLAEVERSLGRPINPTVYSPAEFKTKLSDGNHFLNSVMRGEKVLLIGDEDEFRKLGEQRVA